MADRNELIEYLANRRWEKALDPDNDGDNDTPGSGGDTDNDTPTTPAGIGGYIFGHIAQAEHHVGKMQKAHEAKNPAKARQHHAAAKHHMAAAKAASDKLSSY